MHSRLSLKLSVVRLLVVGMVILPIFAGTVGNAAASDGNPGAIYTMTNSAAGNMIQEYERALDGTLTPGGTFSTGGLGSGSGLGSQGAIVLGQDGRWLFAVNAGSSEISVIAVQSGKLKLVDKASSAGSDPISLTYNHGLLYVLNAGNGGNIAGFRVSSNGQLNFINGSIRLLSNKGVGAAPSPEEIAFTPDGEHLIVTEKGSNLIDTYDVESGKARGPVVNASAGPAPYGFGFGNDNVMVVSEAAQSAASSYKVSNKGLKVISASVLDTQAAACWLVVSDNGRFAYTGSRAYFTSYGFFVDDTFQATRKLTITAGLRWDQPSVFSEASNNDTVFLPNQASPLGFVPESGNRTDATTHGECRSRCSSAMAFAARRQSALETVFAASWIGLPRHR